MRFAHDLVRETEIRQRAEACIAWVLAKDSRLADDPTRDFTRRGFGVYRRKAAVDPLTTADAAVEYASLRTALIEQVTARSAILSLPGLETVPISAADSARVIATLPVAASVSEGSGKPISRLTLAAAPEAPRKVATIVVFSAEWARATNMQAALTRAVVSAVATAADAVLVDLLTDGATASGSDLGTLLSELSDGNPAQPVVLGSYLNLLAQATELDEARRLGVAVVPTSAAEDKLIAVDLAGILVGASVVDPSMAGEADLPMTDDGSGPPTFSLWQNNCLGIRGEQLLSVAKRANAVAWASAGSPA